jgi:hypothetical protein
MKIDCYYSGEDYDKSMELDINNEFEFKVYNMGECPEDANLCRDLSFVYDIPRLLKQAYEAGKNGEEFILNETDIKS